MKLILNNNIVFFILESHDYNWFIAIFYLNLYVATIEHFSVHFNIQWYNFLACSAAEYENRALDNDKLLKVSCPWDLEKYIIF